jgi:prepilin-type N-terminal cleavage/methylation domain-containing protein
MRHLSAFTLVEVMTVMVILGIAAACIVPQIGTRDDLSAAAAARAVMADLLYAQSRAISTQKMHFVEFSGNGYTILARDSDTSPLYTITNQTTQHSYVVNFGSTNPIFPDVNISSVSFDASPSTTIQFDSLGAPWVYNLQQGTSAPLVNNGQITLTTPSAGLTATVLIDPATGEATEGDTTGQ